VLFSILYGFWVANRMAFKGEVARELAAQFLDLAESQRVAVPRMIGHLLSGISLVLTGDLAAGRAHLDRAIVLYDPAAHRALATRFGHDVRISALAWRALALWMLGHPAAARADAERAVEEARAIGHAATSMYALSHASLTLIQRGDHAAAGALVHELVALADEKRASYWTAYGMLLQGWLRGLADNPSDAAAMIACGVAAMRSTGATAYAPWYLSNLAMAHARLGQGDEARRCIGEATAALEATKERWCESEIHRMTGEIALLATEPDAVQAEACFARALAVARAQQARSWELRAAMSMARIWGDQGKRQQARDLVAAVLGSFAEGFDTLDLAQARMARDALAR
jgi:predicted ATPase